VANSSSDGTAFSSFVSAALALTVRLPAGNSSGRVSAAAVGFESCARRDYPGSAARLTHPPRPTARLPPGAAGQVDGRVLRVDRGGLLVERGRRLGAAAWRVCGGRRACFSEIAPTTRSPSEMLPKYTVTMVHRVSVPNAVWDVGLDRPALRWRRWPQSAERGAGPAAAGKESSLSIKSPPEDRWRRASLE